MPTFETIFAVDGNTQTIQTMSGGSIRAKSKHYFTAVFRFGADDPFLELDYLSATFSPVPFERCRNGAYIVPLTPQDREREAAYVAYECEIPWEVLTRKGKVYVGVFAGDMLVTNEAQIEITAAAPVLGADSQPTQSWWARFAAAIAQLTAALIGKQDKLTAGDNITIDSNNVISASGGAAIQPYTGNPAMDGAASAGSSDKFARGDHVHPTDTSRASQTDLDTLEYAVQNIGMIVAPMSDAVSELMNTVGELDRDAIKMTVQSLTTAQQAQARSNINAASIDDIGTVFTIKGEVTNVSDLPATGNTVGDVYYVSSVQAGYIWLKTTDHPNGYWEELGEPIDLSAYRTAAAQDVIDGAQDTAIAAKYVKPSGGIPKTDLASDVQTSLNKADTAIGAPSSPATGAFLVWDGSAWTAQTLATWQGGNY
ncbi:MAG: hypothetical protein II517_04200 [Ruminococcus sp.]|nr:hypothetical protein [Ruminococcus sp.]MBQ2487522.1 hypothetical protein [Ruminococcus sp.]